MQCVNYFKNIIITRKLEEVGMGQRHKARIHRTWCGEGTINVGKYFDTS